LYTEISAGKCEDSPNATNRPHFAHRNQENEMSSVAIDSQLHKAIHFYQAAIGKKVVMAVTGVVLFGYLVGHLAGNLQVYLGQERMDNYAAFLHATPVLLW
jgi:hypothetical protein